MSNESFESNSDSELQSDDNGAQSASDDFASDNEDTDTRVQYTPDYLLTFQPHYKDIPPDLNRKLDEIRRPAPKAHPPRSRPSPKPKPQHRPPAHLVVDQSRDEKMLRDMQSKMNKLTLEMYAPISQKILQIFNQVDSVSLLRGMIHIVFSKALKEPKFSEIYARLCGEIMTSYRRAFDSDAGDSYQIDFKRLLLTACQEEFEKPQVVDDPDKKLSKEEYDEAEYKLRMISLGNSKFIGELYKLGMLPARIMHQCIVRLVNSQSDSPPPDENLETLSRLVTTVGKILESDHRTEAAQFDAYFKQITALSQDMRICSRIRFMLRDLIDLRANEWVPRRVADGPTTIAEVHRTAAQQNLQQKIETQKILSRKSPKRPSTPEDKGPSLRGLASPGRGGKASSRGSPKPPSGGGRYGKNRPPRTPLPVAPRGGRAALTQSLPASPSLALAEAPGSPAHGSTSSSTTSAAPRASAQTLSDEVADRRTVVLLQEYFGSHDHEDSIENFQELTEQVSSPHVLFLAIIRFYADASAGEKAGTEKLLPFLLKAAIFSPDNLEYAFDFFIPDITELIHDTPFLSKYVGALLGLVIAAKILPLSYLTSSPAISNLSKERLTLVASTLNTLLRANPEIPISSIDLNSMSPDGTSQPLQRICQQHKLETLATHLSL